MKENDSQGFNCSDRQAESTDNHATCPSCDAPILALVTRGPSDHFLSPCGCRVTETTARELAGGDVDRGRRMATDGGLSYVCEACGARYYSENAAESCCLSRDNEKGDA
jgi:rubrerythrin